MNPEELFAEYADAGFDVFGDAYDQFREDVDGLILGTLKAALERLHEGAEAQLKDLNSNIRNTGRQFFVDQHVAVMQHNANQERFLRNMAVVALSSRLTHALRKLAKAAAHFKPRTKTYKGGNEYQQLWNEYNDRFAIDFAANANRIAFIEPMRKARNQIVHNASEANPFKYGVSFDDLGKDEDAYLDLSFSKDCAQYVHGTGMDAEVEISEKQLQEIVERSLSLLEWLATELRKQQEAWIGEMNRQRDERKQQG